MVQFWYERGTDMKVLVIMVDGEAEAVVELRGSAEETFTDWFNERFEDADEAESLHDSFDWVEKTLTLLEGGAQ
jgi:hypothetical protein